MLSRARRLILSSLLAVSAACGGTESHAPPTNADAGPGPVVDGGGEDAGNTGVDAGCAIPCGADCCATGQACVNGRCEGSCVPETDATFCARFGRVCGPLAAEDSCGKPRSVASCGACEANKTCNAAGTACEVTCAPETNEAFCGRLKKTCGSVTAPDNCGISRTWNCGSCPTNFACDLATNTCYPTCVDTDRDFCARSGYQCGALAGNDQCGNPRSVVECGPCLATETCDAQHQCRSCTPETDADFCTRMGKNCGTVAGNDNCGVPRNVASCGTCTSPKTCDASNLCTTPGVPSNDDCSSPQILVFDPVTWSATASGDTTKATQSGDGSCNPSSGYDVVYQFTLPATKVVEFTATPASGSSLKPNLYVRSACDQKTSELSCVKTTTVIPAVLSVKLAAGTYFLWVDGYGTGTNGAYTLNALASDPPPLPANDTCPGAQPLTFDATTGKATATGDTRPANNDDAGSCATSSAPFSGGDVVYSFSLSTPQAVSAKVTPDSTSTGFAAAVYLRSVCTSQASTDEVACNKATSGAVTATAASLQAGTYYVIVDGATGSGGSFTLEVTTANPITNDSCASPEPLVFGANGIATLVADNSSPAVRDDTQGSCGGYGPDLVYTFTTTATKILDATVTPAAGATLTPLLYLRTGSTCSGATEVSGTCKSSSSGQPISFNVSSLAAGTYYLWVDGYGGSKGQFTLDVALSDFAANDTCSAPEALTFDTAGVATASGDTRRGKDDGDGSCVGSTGSDLVYQFNTRADQYVEVEVIPGAGSALKPNVYLRSACATTATQAACATSSVVGPVKATVRRLPAGDWFVWVDSYSSASGGPFTLKVTTSAPPPAPANDACLAPKLVDLSSGSASVPGTTLDARNDYAGGCNGTTGMPGGDVVYAFTVPGPDPRSLLAKVTRAASASSSFAPALYIRSACDSAAPSDEKVCAKHTAGVATATIYSLPPGDYYAIVDGLTAADTGAFTLDLTLGPARSYPDTCSGAQLLAFNAGKASVADDTTNAANDSNSLNCVPTSNGNDLVYMVDTTAMGPKNLEARLSYPSTSVYPLLYLRSACATTTAADELACAKATSGGPITVTRNNLPPGVYYLWVDTSSSSHKGAFTLDVTLTDPRANDTCATAQPLAFTNDVATDFGLTLGAVHDYTGTCSTMVGPDVVYTFTIPGPDARSVTASVRRDPAFTTYQPAVYIRAACTSALAADQRACGSNANGTAVASALSLAPGTYSLIVDGVAGTSGAYDLIVQLGPAQQLPDTCATAQPIALNSAGRAVLQGDSTAANDDFESAGCPGVTGGDLVYVLDTTGFDGRDLVATVTYANSIFYPQLVLRSNCSSAAASDEVACARRTSLGGALSLVKTGLPEGVYYLIVDTAYQTDKGPFTLDVRLDSQLPPPANETCANATEIVINPSTGRSSPIVGTTAGGADDYTGTCAAMSGADAVYSFTLAQPASVTAKVTRDTISPTFTPAVYLRGNCLSPAAGDQKACATHASGVATGYHPNLAAGTYYLIVDGTGGTSGKYTLELTTGPAMPGESCADPVPLAFDRSTGVAAVTGSTALAAGDTSGTCGSASGGDLVYSFTTTAPTMFSATVTPATGSALTPALYLRSGASCSAATEYSGTCQYTSTTATAVTTSVATLPAGNYFLWVDGNGSTRGAYSLSVTVLEFAANDTCAAPEAIALDATTGVGTVYGDTRSGRNDGDGSCVGTTGPDLVYSFDLSSPMSVEVELSMPSGSTLKPNLYLRSTCNQTTTQVGCAFSSTAGTTQRLTFPKLGAGVWYVFVDSYSSTSAGAFNLKVTATPPPPAPLNDVCTGIQAMTFDAASNKFTAAGDTTYAGHDTTGTCEAATGADLVYAFTTTQPQKVVAKVVRDTTTATFEPVVYLRAACDQADPLYEVTCAKHTTGTATATVNNLPAGTWYLWVDGAKATYGKFTAEVALSLPASGPANDSCFAAEPITPPASIPGTVTVPGTTAGAVHETAGSCNSSTTTPDVVYSLTLRSDQKIVAKVVPTAGAAYAPAVYIRRSCGSTLSSDQLACATTSTSGTAVTATAKYAAPGTYFIWVDAGSSTKSSGGFNLDVTVDAPVLPPANNTCASPEPLTLGRQATGSTADAENTYQGLSSSACGSSSTSAPGQDVVYSYTPAASGSFTVTVTPTNTTFDPYLWITTGTCGTPSQCVSKADVGYGGDPESLTVSGVAGTTYYFYVDSYSASNSGPFTIKVQ